MKILMKKIKRGALPPQSKPFNPAALVTNYDIHVMHPLTRSDRKACFAGGGGVVGVKPLRHMRLKQTALTAYT